MKNCVLAALAIVLLVAADTPTKNGSEKKFKPPTKEDILEGIALFRQANDIVLKKINAKREEYRKFLQKRPLPNGRGKEGHSVHALRMDAIESSRTRMRLRRAEIESQITMLDAALKEKADPEAIALLVGRWSKTIPLVKDGQPALKPEALIKHYRESLRWELKQIEEQEARLHRWYQQESEAEKLTWKWEVEDSFYRDDLKRLDALYEAVGKRLAELKFVTVTMD
jgi:hypothetical protein